MMTSATLVTLLCVCSLASSQLILDDKRQNLNQIKLVKDIDAGYNIVSPGYSTASYGVASPRSLKWSNVAANPSIYGSSLYNAGLLRGGGGLSSFTLGGVPSSAIALTSSPRTYGTTLLANQGLDLGFQGRTVGLDISGARGVDLGLAGARDVNLGLVGARGLGLDISGARGVDLGITGARSLGLGVGTARFADAGAVHQDTQPVTAAVANVGRTVDYIPVGFTGRATSTQVVNVPPNEQGLHINFVSKSSPLTVSSQHIPSEASQVSETESVDEPLHLRHNVKKAVVQEINEVVQPYRVLKQEVKPVIEQAHLAVAHGENIPLSGRSSGIIAADTGVNAGFGLNAGLTGANLAAVNRQVLVPQTATIAVARPQISTIGLSERLVEPAVTRVAVAQPAVSRVAIAQPTRVEFAGDVAGRSIAGGGYGLQLADANAAGFGLNGNLGKASLIQTHSTSPLVGNIGFRRQNIGLVNPISANLETSKFILSQPAASSSSLVTSRFVRQPQQLKAKIARY